MATLNRLPVFTHSFDGGKTYRIIDGETNHPARNGDGELLDRGGINNEFVALCMASRVNELERGINDDGAAIRAWETFSALFVDTRDVQATSDDDDAGRWMYEQWQQGWTKSKILAEFQTLRAERDWYKVTSVNGISGRIARYAEANKRPLRKGKGGRPKRPK